MVSCDIAAVSMLHVNIEKNVFFIFCELGPLIKFYRFDCVRADLEVHTTVLLLQQLTGHDYESDQSN